MKLNLLIDEETGENFSYESSIDEQTFNKIKLAFNNEKTGKRELYVAQDGDKMNQWGVLQYFEEVQTQTGASAKADALLKLYDQKTRHLTIKNAFGDVRVRAGSAVVVALNLGDMNYTCFQAQPSGGGKYWIELGSLKNVRISPCGSVGRFGP